MARLTSDARRSVTAQSVPGASSASSFAACGAAPTLLGVVWNRRCSACMSQSPILHLSVAGLLAADGKFIGSLESDACTGADISNRVPHKTLQTAAQTDGTGTAFSRDSIDVY